jgi:Icc-related predicted phosphoesterase
VRVAAIGDLHVRATDDARSIRGLTDLRGRAEVLVVAGDITDNGRLVEAEAAGALLAEARIPIVAVLGNHDRRSLRRSAFRRTLERAGIMVLDGDSTSIVAPSGARIGFAGATGSGGGFWPEEGPDAIHARTLKQLAVRAARECQALQRALLELDADVRIAVTHFAPTVTTLGVEPLTKYWMLGNSELGAVVDRRMPHLVIHGHAHLGRLEGRTPGGVPVRNVALPVVGGVHVESFAPTRRGWASIAPATVATP